MTLAAASVGLSGLTRVIAVVLAVGLLLLLLELVRRRALQERYVALWGIAALCLLLISVFPPALQALADMLGVADTSIAIFVVVFGFLMLLALSLTVIVSRLSEKTTRMAQEIAFLKQQINEGSERE